MYTCFLYLYLQCTLITFCRLGRDPGGARRRLRLGFTICSRSQSRLTMTFASGDSSMYSTLLQLFARSGGASFFLRRSEARGQELALQLSASRRVVLCVLASTPSTCCCLCYCHCCRYTLLEQLSKQTSPTLVSPTGAGSPLRQSRSMLL